MRATTVAPAHRRRLEQLSDEERRAFLLVECEGLSRREAASILGLPSGTVASRLGRARERLERALTELDEQVSNAVAPFAERSLVVGNQRFETNAWGADKSQSRFEQRIIQRPGGTGMQLGWYWYWPGFERSVFAYPEVFIGWKPWLGGTTTDLRLPVHIASSAHLEVEYSVEVRATGSYNVALSTWLSRASSCQLAPSSRSITTEIMVWTDYTSGATPPGKLVGQLGVERERYELWQALGYGKRYKRDDIGWTVLTLRGVGGQRRGTVPLGLLLAELVRRGFVDPDQYVTCVELGNEVMGGVGTTFVERFALAL